MSALLPSRTDGRETVESVRDAPPEPQNRLLGHLDEAERELVAAQEAGAKAAERVAEEIRKRRGAALP